jgi:putative cobalt transporter subunit CbtB
MAYAATLPYVVVAPKPIAISVREWLPWAIFAGAVLLFLGYIVGLDQGATSLFGGSYIHEFMHDARHLLGFPCH